MPLLQAIAATGSVAGWTNSLNGRYTTDDGVTGGPVKVIGGRAFASTADSAVVANIAAPTLTDTTFVIPANTLGAGSILKIRAICRTIARNGGNFSYALRLQDANGPTDMVVSTPGATAPNNRVLLEGHTIFRGAPGAAVGTSSYYSSCDLGVAVVTGGPAAGAPLNLNTAGTITVQIEVIQSAQNAGNQSVCESLYVEII